MNSSHICTGESPRSSGLIPSDMVFPQQMIYGGRQSPQESTFGGGTLSHMQYTHPNKCIILQGQQTRRPHLQSLNCLCVQTHWLCLLTHKEKALSVHACTVSVTEHSRSPPLTSPCLSLSLCRQALTFSSLVLSQAFSSFRLLHSVHSAGVRARE